MNGLTIKAILLGLAFLSTSLLPLSTFAHSPNSKIYSTKLGCMACHQDNSIQPVINSKNSQHNLRRQNQAKTKQAK